MIATHDPAAIDFADCAHFVETGRLYVPPHDELALWLTEGTSIESVTST